MKSTSTLSAVRSNLLTFLMSILVWTVLLMAGCAEQAEVPATPFTPVLDVHDLMNSVLDPATDVIWGAAGAVITAAGEQDLAPVDDAGWQAVYLSLIHI